MATFVCTPLLDHNRPESKRIGNRSAPRPMSAGTNVGRMWSPWTVVSERVGTFPMLE